MKMIILAIVVALGCAQAHAQWTQYRLGNTTYYQGHTPQGSWNGSSYNLGGTTYTDLTGPNGEQKHCSSYMLGTTRYTDCH